MEEGKTKSLFALEEGLYLHTADTRYIIWSLICKLKLRTYSTFISDNRQQWDAHSDEHRAKRDLYALGGLELVD